MDYLITTGICIAAINLTVIALGCIKAYNRGRAQRTQTRRTAA